MKKIVQPNVRKVYGPSQIQQQQSDIQMNAVRKINSLLSSGAVTVERTGPTTQPRILKKLTTTPTNNHQLQKCYICDEAPSVQSQSYVLTEAVTSVTHTKLPNKIGHVVGDAFMVIVCVEDIICKKCLTIFNQMDRLESDLERVKNTILNFINKKYGITSDSDDSIKTNNVAAAQPPVKMQKLNTGNTYMSRKIVSEDDDTPRKMQVTRQIVNRSGGGGDAVENQMNSMFESPERRNNTTTTQAVHIVQQTQPSNKRGPIKIYKCMSCDFKTTDLKQFQPHYEQCKQLQNSQQPLPQQQQQQQQVAQATTQIHTGFRCKLCKKLFATLIALRHHTAEKHPAEYTCNICNVNFVNEPNYKKHMETAHPDIKTIENRIVTSIQTKNQVYACTMCQYKTPDKQNYDDHLRKHVKVKPFKCRICAARFETREQASIHAKGHQPDYFKCGSCSMSFPQREMLIKHFETHENKSKAPQQIIQQQPKALTTQKLLQETIDEALRDPIDQNEQAKQINFLSCNICSLTFLQEHYYIQHMETQHKKTIQPAGNNGNVSTSTVVTTNPQGQSLIRQDVRNTNATILNTQTNSISEDDLESIFEKMHSDKGDGEGANSNSGDNLVITTQENSGGGITFNITIPQQEGNEINQEQNQKIQISSEQNQNENQLMSVPIDMPVLEHNDESEHHETEHNQQQIEQQEHQLQQQMDEEQQQQQAQLEFDQQQEHEQQQLEQQHHQQQEMHDDENSQNQMLSGPVSMPSLDDENEENQHQNQDDEHLPMDMDDVHNSVDGGGIKFILNENGQLLQLEDNHIITTDADGNQIIVQGGDSEQLQQLLQSVGVMQSGDGMEGDTMQLISGENNQMILVQQGDNEPQLIDASMLNADGHLVIQQDGQGGHTTEDGTPISFVQHSDEMQEDDGSMTEHHQQQMEGESDENKNDHHVIMQSEESVKDDSSQETSMMGESDDKGDTSMEQ